ncbi:hypothetical protein PhaeoP97_01569 [Phaeobacter porticola]|uniref:Uncharacterized protein n=1 Tax=Phaeobacter porticola TaxID=1844006 RepID=A0A1L3I4E3_9RHOB|nr:hypothetical protein PhaeoP97_01569 [Phaeobacter porticola]
MYSIDNLIVTLPIISKIFTIRYGIHYFPNTGNTGTLIMFREWGFSLELCRI